MGVAVGGVVGILPGRDWAGWIDLWGLWLKREQAKAAAALISLMDAM